MQSSFRSFIPYFPSASFRAAGAQTLNAFLHHPETAIPNRQLFDCAQDLLEGQCKGVVIETLQQSGALVSSSSASHRSSLTLRLIR